LCKRSFVEPDKPIGCFTKIPMPREARDELELIATVFEGKEEEAPSPRL
jgi:hypothetical protein